jgi:hypothetical protein
VQPQSRLDDYVEMSMTGIAQVWSIILVSDRRAADLLRQAQKTTSLQQVKACVELLYVRAFGPIQQPARNRCQSELL